MIPTPLATAFLGWLGAFYLLTGSLTTTYPPIYFAQPKIQGVFTVIVALFVLAYALTGRMGRWTVTRWGVPIGAGVVGVAFSRGMAILFELGTQFDEVLLGRAVDPRDTSLFIAGLQWWTIGICVALLWPHLMRAVELPAVRSREKEHENK